MSWFSAFKLGPLGGELSFPCQVVTIEVPEGNVDLEQRNLRGGMMRSYLRANVPQITMQLAQLSDGLLAVLRGFQQSLAPLNFIYNSSLQVKYQMATSQSTTVVVVPLTSATGVTINGVYLQSDYLQAGTNYYSGGSTFDPVTGTITLATPLPGANTAVWVNYGFTGISCWVRVRATPHLGAYKDYWQATLELTGA
jgi:hypothetical protein